MYQANRYFTWMPYILLPKGALRFALGKLATGDRLC